MYKFPYEGFCEGLISKPSHDLPDMLAPGLRAPIIDREIRSNGINLTRKKGQHHIVGLFSNIANLPGMQQSAF